MLNKIFIMRRKCSHINGRFHVTQTTNPQESVHCLPPLARMDVTLDHRPF